MRKCSQVVRALGAAVLSILVAITAMPVSVLAAEEARVITIENETEFLLFADQCHLDSFSQGLTVELKKDLDLSGEVCEDFQGIPSFSGIFYGNGYTISGLHLIQESGAAGLFCYLEEGAVVQRLHVEGVVSASESDDPAGGIAGVNAGTLQYCSFEGKVTGKGITGGIAGENSASATIHGCTVSGSVVSEHTVGGVAGRNYGVITDCENQSDVNSDSSWLHSGEEEASDSILTMGKEKLESGTDIGGIAGYSTGLIAGCKNTGIVGYLYSGSNVGGIAGRQKGSILNCINSGKIYGKQDVGGIVGQFEPYMELKDAEKLEEEVDKLHDIIDGTADDLERMSDDLQQDFSDLQDHADMATDASEAILRETKDVVKANVSVLNELAGRVDYVSDRLPGILDSVDGAIDAMKKLNEDMDQVREDLDIEDKMEQEEYDPAAHDRLALLSGIGGSLTSDNRQPEEGAAVTITVEPKTGYRLKSLSYTEQGKAAIDITEQVTENTYTLSSMPKANVTFSAVFDYTGEYVADSNAGGRISLSEGEEQVKIKVAPDGGYEIGSVTVDGEDITGQLVKEEDSDSYTASLDKKQSGEPILAEAFFVKSAESHTITIVNGTGGTVTAQGSQAAAGTEVTLTVNTAQNYRLGGLSVSGAEPEMTGEKTYTFTMPDSDVTVTAYFTYTPDEDTEVYTESDPGGTVTAVPVPGTNDVLITIVPDSANGYGLAEEGTVLAILEGAERTLSKELALQDLEDNGNSYRYTLNTNNYTAPVCVYGYFTKDSQTRYTVVTSCSTGGVLLADESQAAAGDTVTVAAAGEAHYRLKSLEINGVDMTDQVENGKLKYTVPDSQSGDIEITADFDPVLLKMTSTNVSGSASYTVENQQVVLTILPDTGYVPESVRVLDTDGSTELMLRKEYADSYIYKFDVTEGMKAKQAANLTVTFFGQSNKDTLEGAKDSLENNSDQVSDSMDDISNIYDNIQELLTDEFGEIREIGDLSDSELEELEDYMLDLAEALTDAGISSGEMLRDIQTIIDIMEPYVGDAYDAVKEDLDAVSSDLDTMTDSFSSASDQTQAIVDYLNSLQDIQFVNFSGDIDTNTDKLSAEMDTISDILRRINDHTGSHSDKLEADLRSINDQLNVVLELLIERIDNIEELAEGNIYEDLSAEDPLYADAARVKGCSNTGLVDGRQNTGGIAGTLGVEIAEEDDEISLGCQYAVRAVLEDCKNNGFITVKNQNGGGIVGALNLGYVSGCMGSGSITSDAGNYLGGIAGTSEGTIANCYSMAELSGGTYLGGIAGRADTVYGCYSMAAVTDGEGRIGAVIGADMPKEDQDYSEYRSLIKEQVHDNYFVSSTLYGIDGISYAGIAEPITYEALLAVPDIPEDFSHLQILFVDGNGKVVQRMEMEYGADLSDLEYPLLAAEDGSYTDWQGQVGSRMEGNIILRSEDISNVTILSSPEKVSGRSIALAEGAFTENAEIHVTAAGIEPPEALKEGSTSAVYTVTLEHTGLSGESITRVRLLGDEERKVIIYALSEGQWQEQPAKQIGRYMEVSMTGTEATFCVVTQAQNSLVTYLIIGITLMAAVIVITIISMYRKHKKAKAG